MSLFFVGDRHFNEFAAQRFDLLFGRMADIEGFDHGAQTFGGGNGLQAGNASAQNQHLGRFDRACGGHEHGHEARVILGGQQHRLVAADIGLGGQHIHRLRARGA